MNPALKVLPARKELKAFKACQAHKVKLAAKGRRGRKVPRGRRAIKVILGDVAKGEKGDKGDQGDAAPSSIRAVAVTNAPVACESTEDLVSVFCPNGGVSEGPKCATPVTIGLCLRK